MRISLVCGLSVAASVLGCGGADAPRPVAGPARLPDAIASASTTAPAELPPPVEIRLEMTHRFYVARSSFELPLLEAKDVRAGPSPKEAAQLTSVEREVATLLRTRAEVAAAWGRFEHCTGFAAIDGKPRSCDAEDRKLSSLNERFLQGAQRVDERIDDAVDAMGSDARTLLSRSYLADQRGWVKHATDTTAPGELDVDRLDATFELGESASAEASGEAYREASQLVPAGAPGGVLVRERAAVEAMVHGRPEEATRWLDEARGVATGAELTDVLFLSGQAHARRFPDGVAEAERALEGALSGEPSPRVHRVDVATALMLAAYRASDFPRALAVALDLDAGRFRDPPPPPVTTKAEKGAAGLRARVAELGVLAELAGSVDLGLSLDGTTSARLRIEADAVERIGLDRVDLTKADDEDEQRLRGELAIRALYLGDVARARGIVAGARRPANDARAPRFAAALAILCARGAAPEGVACDAPKDAPTAPKPRADGSSPPPVIEDEELAGAREADAPLERRVFALARLCVEPAFLGLSRQAHGAAAETRQEIVLTFTPGREPSVSTSAVGDGRALELVASCMATLGPPRLSDRAVPIVAHVDVTHASRRWKSTLPDLLHAAPPPSLLDGAGDPPKRP